MIRSPDATAARHDGRAPVGDHVEMLQAWHVSVHGGYAVARRVNLVEVGAIAMLGEFGRQLA